MPGISVYNKCNNSCLMCTNPDEFWEMDGCYFSLTYLSERIERFRNGTEEFLDNFRDSFSISGGEPTLASHLSEVIKKINSLFPGIRIVCLTNGRMFSYADYVRQTLRLNANLEFAVSLHGHNAGVHDKITQTPGSFTQTVTGLKNIFRFKRPDESIEIRVVIHRLNYKFLEEIAGFIKMNFPQVNRLVFMFFEIEGQAVKNLKALRLTYAQLSPYIDKIFNFIALFPQVRLYHFPLCTLPPKFYPYIWRTLPDFEVSFPESCKECGLKKLCLGVHKGYLKYVGSSEFRPIKDKIRIRKGRGRYHPIIGVGGSSS
ncbi:MAG: radical SAM protein [Deltaproteobacteria bacterium]|nr:radical SAM protein [Deltaproteobacteria bacterium]